MKKIFIAAGLIIVFAIFIFTVAKLTDDNATTVVTDTTNNDESITTHTHKSETDINVDGWLKITKIYEYDGRLAVVAENVSDVDVEYALLTVKTRNGSFSFNVSALLRGTKGILICNESVGFNPDEIYTGWQTENIVNFKKTPVMNNDKYEVSVTDGSISVKNVSGENITSDIFIYYKDKKDDMLNGSVTHRIRIPGLKADSQTYVNAPGLNEKNCQNIFTEYDDKEV